LTRGVERASHSRARRQRADEQWFRPWRYDAAGLLGFLAGIAAFSVCQLVTPSEYPEQVRYVLAGSAAGIVFAWSLAAVRNMAVRRIVDRRLRMRGR